MPLIKHEGGLLVVDGKLANSLDCCCGDPPPPPPDPCDCTTPTENGIAVYLKVTVEISGDIIIPHTNSPCCTQLRIRNGADSNGTYIFPLTRTGCPHTPLWRDVQGQTQAMSPILRDDYNFNCSRTDGGTANGSMFFETNGAVLNTSWAWGFGSIPYIGDRQNILAGCPVVPGVFAVNQKTGFTGDGVNCNTVASRVTATYTYEHIIA